MSRFALAAPRLATAALLLAATAAPALAQPGASTGFVQFLTTGDTPACGGNSYVFCVGATGAVDVGSWQLRLTVDNSVLNAPGTFFGEFVIGNLASAYTPTALSWTGAGEWKLPNGNSSANSPNGYQGQGMGHGFGFNTVKDGQGTFGPGGTTVFTFVLDKAPVLADFAAAQLGVHSQGGLAACGSSKVVINADGSVATTTGAGAATNPCNVTVEPPPPPTTAVPEPGTVVLTASGLLGLAAVARRRRAS